MPSFSLEWSDKGFGNALINAGDGSDTMPHTGTPMLDHPEAAPCADWPVSRFSSA